jgi:uncharacterized protein with PhoU and TrkA domain
MKLERLGKYDSRLFWQERRDVFGGLAMKEIPDEKDLLELLEMARIFEQQMKEQCDLAKVIYEKYEKRIRESGEVRVLKS